jgi:hypothetical protein
MRKYYWYSLSEGFFITKTPFVEQVEGLRSVSLEEYAAFKIAESKKQKKLK